MTTKQVADYFEVGLKAIQSVYLRNQTEIDSDGTSHKKANVFRVFNMKTLKTSKRGSTSFQLEDGSIIEVQNFGVKCFSPRAVLRIAMLLRDSEVAKEVRTQLLNTVEHATVEQKTIEINNELDLGKENGEAYSTGDMNRLLTACMSYNSYLNRHINFLKTENDMLAKVLAKWGFSKTFNALIRSYAYCVFDGNYSMAWNTYYKELYSKLGIGLKLREGGKTLLSRIKPWEEKEAIKVAAAMCELKKLDIKKIINEVNANNINIKQEGEVNDNSTT